MVRASICLRQLQLMEAPSKASEGGVKMEAPKVEAATPDPEAASEPESRKGEDEDAGVDDDEDEADHEEDEGQQERRRKMEKKVVERSPKGRYIRVSSSCPSALRALRLLQPAGNCS